MEPDLSAEGCGQVDDPDQPPLLRLLGPVEIGHAGRVIEVGPPQRQAVLAALAVDAQTPVSVDLLLDRVWGARPPDGARAALHAHITRLRRVLAQAESAPVRLARHNGGYVLELERDRVDLHYFRRLVEHARTPQCDDDARVALVRQALRIWRGPPLASVPGDWAGRLRHSIEPQFISAAVMWAQSTLRLGHAEAVIDKLGQLSSLHPLSEPLVAELMRALCAVGRRAEALQRYAATRAHLREELGTEPGSELSGLHTAILRGELDAAVPRPPAAGAGHAAPLLGPSCPPPRQLPAPAAGFAGRGSELAAIESAVSAALREGWAPVVAINGYGGVGKSALAIHAAHRLAEQFPGGSLYVDLGGYRAGHPRPTTAALLDGFLRALAVRPERGVAVEEVAARFRAAAASRRVLTVLDNADDPAQVRLLSPGVPGSAVLVTSRRVLVGLDGAHHLHLDLLPEPEAVELLARMIGTSRVAAEPAAAAEVVRWCGHLPLAVRAAGARLAARPRWPISALARRLADEAARLDELDFAGCGLRDSFAVSLRALTRSADRLDRAAATAFADLGGWGRAQFPVGDAARLLARPVVETERLLDRLVDARMLDSPIPAWYRMPHLLRLYARQTVPEA